ncbi:MAG: M20/M25/M40 family metallo-hydrolase, partial [Candidatus Ranarchaeia archaeon]
MEPEQLLIEMVRISSITKNEHSMANYLMKKCHQAKINARIDKVGNLIAEIGDPHGHPCILLFGHMDTVAPFLPVTVDREKGILYGRGSVDAKGPLATFIQCMYNLRAIEKGRLIVVGAVEEEGRSKGAHHFIKSGIMESVDYAIIGEPSNTVNITIGYRGSLNIRLKIETEPGHTSNPNVRNSIEDFLTIHQKLVDVLPITKNRGKQRNLTIRPMWIKAFTPNELKVYYNIRVPFNLTCDHVINVFKRVIGDFNKEANFAKVNMEIHDRADPYQLKQKNNELIKNLRSAIEKRVGNPPRLIRKTGTADINVLGNAYPNIPMF